MAQPAGDSHQFVSGISLTGRSRGVVRQLAGFRKRHHTVPDAVNATTTAFLGKLCAGELQAEAEGYFQRAKTALRYKRADLALEVAGPDALLTAKDFVFAISYALDPPDPAAYVVTRTLHRLRHGSLVEQPEFDGLFAGVFSGIAFGLTQGARVEAVIDAVEGLGDDSALTVHYPSDYRHCRLSVAGLEAEVVCDGTTLEMSFPRNGSPRELVAAFSAVRSAFALTRSPVLAGLL